MAFHGKSDGIERKTARTNLYRGCVENLTAGKPRREIGAILTARSKISRRPRGKFLDRFWKKLK